MWLQQIENMRAKWTNSEAMLESCQLLMCHMGPVARKTAAVNPHEEADSTERKHIGHSKARHSSLHYLQQGWMHVTG